MVETINKTFLINTLVVSFKQLFRYCLTLLSFYNMYLYTLNS